MRSHTRHQHLHASDSNRPDRLAKVPWVAVAIYAAIAFALAWLVILPLWLTDATSAFSPVLAGVLPPVMMFTPLVATLIVVFGMKIPQQARLRFLGIWPLRPVKRIVWFIIAMIFVPIVFVVASLAVSLLFGWAQLDLVHFSNFQAMLGTPLDDSALRPVILMQLALMPFAAIFNAIPAFGEEIGWRGWLLPALRPMGVWPALLLSGLIWGLWHAPLILLGHNFNQPNIWGLIVMLFGCVLWGIFFGWLRLRSGSLWPAVIAHGALNASGGVVLLLTSADPTMNLALVNPLGVSGWIVLGIVTLLLLVSGQFKHEPQLAPQRAVAELRLSAPPEAQQDNRR